MKMNVAPSEPSRSTTLTVDEVEAEVLRRLKLLQKDDNTKKEVDNSKEKGTKKKADGHERRFPKTISKIAYGSALVSKNEFIQEFDYGIPKPPSKREYEKDPGKDDVLLLYNSKASMPDDNTGIVYTNEGPTAEIPHLSATDATKNCGVLNVIYTDSHGGAEQCMAIVGNYESYHIQRWLRFDGRKVDPTFPLHAVGRGVQSNGANKFEAPSDRYALQNQALLETYFDRLEETIQILTPMAATCAGDDNTVIVMVCNTGQSDLLINFLCSADARGFGDIVREKLLIFATDEGVLEIAKGLGVHVFYDEKVSTLISSCEYRFCRSTFVLLKYVSIDSQIFEQMPEQEAKRYGDRAFTQMMYAKIVTVQLINRMGYDVLFQDVDLVWYKNPLPYFHDKENPVHNFDILFQDDGARSLRYAPYSANTGFYYVRNNDKTKFLFRSLLFLGDMVLSMTSHQQALAALLDEHSSLTGLRVKTLSGSEFPGGYHYHRKKEIDFMRDIATGKNTPFLLHMSWTTNKNNKLLFLKQMGLWYTKEACESGGAVALAKDSTGTSLQQKCCSAEALISCHYRDKPSDHSCQGQGRNIDANGKPFWK